MILDAHNEFSNAQALTATAISTNVIDTGNFTKDLGAGDQMWLIVRTQTLLADVGSDATLTVTLESAADEALTSGPVVHASSGALAFAAASPAGATLLAVPLPQGEYKRYLGVRYTVGAGPFTAGNVDAFLTRDPQQWRAYANGNVV